MASRWMCRDPLTIDERREIKKYLDLDITYRGIAGIMHRAKSTISREARRLGETVDYDPDRAQEHFEKLQMQTRDKIRQTLKNKSHEKKDP